MKLVKRTRVIVCVIFACVLAHRAWVWAQPSLRSFRLHAKAQKLRRAETLRYLPTMATSATWASDAVPKTIHFVVPNNESAWHPVWRRCHNSWRQHMPSYRLRFWNDDAMETLVTESYPQFAKLYTDYTRQIQRADMARYLILHREGGVYADSDYQCVREFDQHIPAGRVTIAESPHGGEGVQNSLMASPPYHPFWAHVMRELLHNAYVEDVVLSTGPRALLHAYDKAPDGMVHILPRGTFAQWPGKAVQRVQNIDHAQFYRGREVYAVHLGTSLWSHT